MNWDNNAPEGRAIFETSIHARDAVLLLDGKVEFDTGKVLSASLANDTLDLPGHGQMKRTRTESFPAAVPPVVPQVIMTPYNAVAGQTAGMLPYVPPPPIAFQTTAGPSILSSPRAYAPVKNVKDNPPCNTLFIGNLGDQVDEAELRAVFG